MRYTLSEIASIVGGVLHGGDIVASGIATDSRNICPVAALFVAMRGVNHDGHDFVEELIGRGVRGFMVEKLPEGDFFEHCGFVVVENSLEALQKLAKYHRKQFKGVVVGITGSRGKTVVKEWIGAMWSSENGRLFRSPRSYNSSLGVALSLLMIEGDERVAVIEAGISRVGEMEVLQDMIHPDVVILTNIGVAHSENFENSEQKLAQKMILARGTRLVITPSQEAQTIEQQNFSCVEQLFNSLRLKMLEFEKLPPVAMRLERSEGLLGSLIIADTFCSDLNSLRGALDFTRKEAAGRDIMLVLSDIMGSGADKEALYGAVARMLEESQIKDFVGIGEDMMRHRACFTHGEFYKDPAQMLTRFDSSKIKDKVVLIKGTHGSGLEKIVHSLESHTHTTMLEVNLGAMSENLNLYRSKLRSGVKTMAMIKAQGYGMGSVGVARMLQAQAVDYLAVAFADEGVELREAGIHLPIVVLNADSGSFAVMLERDLQPEIYNLASLREFIERVRLAGVSERAIHIKIDSGMHRLGMSHEELKQAAQLINSSPQVTVASIFSHLASADMPSFDDFTRSQIELFDELSSEFCASLQQDITPLRHILNSSGIERFCVDEVLGEKAQFDMVRLGLGLYGGGAMSGSQGVCRLVSRVVQLKKVPKGDTVGYTCRGIAQRDTLLAVVPIGYADGLRRSASNGAWNFKIGSHFAPIIGNVSMDTTIVDVTDIDSVSLGDEVEIFGWGESVEALAVLYGTISYEVLTSISSRIKRVYID